jgi:hypothetical protein
MSSVSRRNMWQIRKIVSVLRPRLASWINETAAARRFQRFVDLVQRAFLEHAALP